MSAELYGLVQSKITTDDIQAFKAQAKKMKDATENEIGTISYDFFISEEKREVFIVEKYADDKAFMAHMEQFLQEEFIPKILTMMELTSLKMLGPVTEEIDDFFAKGGWTYDAYPLAI
jgi:quinol monooxygenase YgiN